ncbi:protein jagged-1-like [Haliotis asinina]|uniref:protein jagged-1-like n=1 Tax=Haliotis asinina TaxID=109174 RepID=UPI0035323EDB
MPYICGSPDRTKDTRHQMAPRIPGGYTQRVKTDGKLDIRFIRYSSHGRTLSGDCCDGFFHGCPDKCDPMFVLCISRSVGGNLCSLYVYTTDYMDNHNEINFRSSFQGTPNPFVIDVLSAVPSSIKIQVEVYDHDGRYSPDHVDTLSKSINIQAAATEQMAVYTSYTLRRRTELEIAVRAYCDSDWYGSSCEKYCKATTDHGHYRCHLQTGAKVCLEGWKGEKCDQDIDECTEINNTCQNGGTCRNSLGSFQCICMEGVKGRRCENIINQCVREPCLNGGTCDGNETAFNCACSVEWTGETCAEKINFCDSAPCDRGNCTQDFLAATMFKCSCDFGWVGERCSLHVDIVNITLLGEIDHTNRDDLADGLNRLITKLGGIPGKVDVKFMTNSHRENNFTSTYVQLYCVVENGSLKENALVEIFESNPQEVINEYLPLPLYPPRDEEEEKATVKLTPPLSRVVNKCL